MLWLLLIKIIKEYTLFVWQYKTFKFPVQFLYGCVIQIAQE